MSKKCYEFKMRESSSFYSVEKLKVECDCSCDRSFWDYEMDGTRLCKKCDHEGFV